MSCEKDIIVKKVYTSVDDTSWILDSQQPVDKKERRKSWHALKFDKKRKKSSFEHGSMPEMRQKRPSWWNLFTNQQFSRSKSKSVDHGQSNPFSLEALHKEEKVVGQSSLDERSTITERQKEALEDITTYVVSDRDTLTSVAARFDTTPSELTKLNKLATPYIFPGQKLYLPCKKNSEESESKTTLSAKLSEDVPSEEKELLDNLRPVSPKPGHVERVQIPFTAHYDEESSPFTARFLKINVRHITDGQGVASGVLLVTPNAVMFDPNVSDTLVIEHGPEAYGVIAPMEYVVNIAIYYDIAHIRIGHMEDFQEEKPVIYHAKPSEKGSDEQESDSLMIKDETYPELVAGDDEESVCSSTERDGSAFPKAFERELVTPVNIESNSKHPVADDKQKLLLDHHWAVPSKDRHVGDIESTDKPSISSKQENEIVEETCQDLDTDILNSSTPSENIRGKLKSKDGSEASSKDWDSTNVSVSEPLSDTYTESPVHKKATSVSFSIDSNEKSVYRSLHNSKDGKDETEAWENKKSKMLKRLSYPLTWMETFSLDKEQEKPAEVSSDSHPSVFSKVFSRRSSIDLISKQPGESSKSLKQPHPKLDYKSMVSVEDVPELFVSFDKLIPKPARSCDDPPLYLRLRMGKPINKPIPKSTSLMSYGKKGMRPEYWFSIPRNRVDDLYNFIQAWFPHLYGELDEEQIKSRGCELIKQDTILWSEEGTPSKSKDISPEEDVEITKQSWEVLPAFDNAGKTLSSGRQLSLDVEGTLPELYGISEILTEEHRTALYNHLPARAEGYSWTLVFSTSQHGFSLNSLYRKMYKLESPILLIIQDTNNNVFGALTSCAFQVSDHFYGTGESLLFTFTPKFRVYNWTGENLYFIKGNNESLSIGAGDGKFGLWLDGDLYQGRTEACKTYGNEPLTPNTDFVVKTLECWAFI